MNHPQIIDDITPAWLSDALRAGGTLRRATVSRVELTPIGAGLGFLSGIALARLTYDQAEEGAPASVVVKLPAAGDAGRDLGNAINAYEREVRFYREIAAHTPVRVPRCYYNFMD